MVTPNRHPLALVGALLAGSALVVGVALLVTIKMSEKGHALRDHGQTVELNGGEVTGLEGYSVEERSVIQTAMTQKRLALPAFLQELRMATQPVNGPAGEPSVTLVRPVMSVLREPRPEFVWRTPEGAWAYTITVTNSRGEQVARGETTATLSWRPEQELPAGETLRWEVTARNTKGESVRSAVPAPFRVVDADTVQRLYATQQRHPGGHLLMAVEYAKAGLIPEAQLAVAGLIRENQNSPLISDFLASLVNGQPGRRKSQ